MNRSTIAGISMRRQCSSCSRQVSIQDLREGVCWECNLSAQFLEPGRPMKGICFAQFLEPEMRKTAEGRSIANYKSNWPF